MVIDYRIFLRFFRLVRFKREGLMILLGSLFYFIFGREGFFFLGSLGRSLRGRVRINFSFVFGYSYYIGFYSDSIFSYFVGY